MHSLDANATPPRLALARLPPSSPSPSPRERSTLKALNKSLQSELSALQSSHRQLNETYERLLGEYKALVDAQEHFATEFTK